MKKYAILTKKNDGEEEESDDDDYDSEDREFSFVHDVSFCKIQISLEMFDGIFKKQAWNGYGTY